MVATVVLGPGKPRLVQIQRPSSRSSVSPPKTPVQSVREVSAFSPYDTPSRGGSASTGLLRNWSSQSLLPAPLSFSERLMKRVDSGVSVSKFTYNWSPEARLDRRSQIRLVLDTIANAIDSFPNGIRLDSEAIRALRKSTHTDENHISCLQKIFPAPLPLLSALAAWLIVDLYLIQLDLEWQHSPELRRNIPQKARAMLGIPMSYLDPEDDLLRRRAQMIHVSVGVIGQRLLEAIRGSWDEDLWTSLRVLTDVIEASEFCS